MKVSAFCESSVDLSRMVEWMQCLFGVQSGWGGVSQPDGNEESE